MEKIKEETERERKNSLQQQGEKAMTDIAENPMEGEGKVRGTAS